MDPLLIVKKKTVICFWLPSEVHSAKRFILHSQHLQFSVIKEDGKEESFQKTVELKQGFCYSSSVTLEGHEHVPVTKEVSQEYSRTILSGGEVLVNVRGSLGGCSIVPNDMAGYNIAREVAKISPDVSINNKYLMYYLLSHCFVDYRTRHLAGSVYIGLNIELLSSCPIPFPELFEQQQITDYLDRKCSQIDKLIALKHQKTEKIQQYKKSLIYEYVTGKKEV